MRSDCLDSWLLWHEFCEYMGVHRAVHGCVWSHLRKDVQFGEGEVTEDACLPLVAGEGVKLRSDWCARCYL